MQGCIPPVYCVAAKETLNVYESNESKTVMESCILYYILIEYVEFLDGHLPRILYSTNFLDTRYCRVRRYVSLD